MATGPEDNAERGSAAKLVMASDAKVSESLAADCQVCFAPSYASAWSILVQTEKWTTRSIDGKVLSCFNTIFTQQFI